MHVDTEKKFEEMYKFRDKYEKEWKLNLIKGDCPSVDEIDPSLPPAARSAARKTEGLKKILKNIILKELLQEFEEMNKEREQKKEYSVQEMKQVNGTSKISHQSFGISVTLIIPITYI